jgi:hypothetical protein
MRRVSSTSTLAVLLLLAGSAAADVVVLKDGRKIETLGPPVLKGRMILLKSTDGTLFSIPADEVDQAKTDAARARPAPAPTPTPATSLRSARPAEIAGKKSERRATVVLTDDQVAAGSVETEGEKKEDGEERVDVANATATKSPAGYSVAGSVLNSGKSEVGGIAVTIEAIGPGGKTIATTYGQVAKDLLAPGEKSTFTAELKETADITTFRYTARWQSRIPVKGAAAVDWGEGVTPPKPPEGAEAKKDEEAGKPAEPKPSPTPAYVRIPSPDVAPRAPNAPIGAPEKPGGTFIPKPTGDQPKPPAGN